MNPVIIWAVFSSFISIIMALRFRRGSNLVEKLTLNRQLTEFGADKPPMPDKPPISIIVPFRNEERTIESGLLSILKSDYSEIEVVAVNDHSSDSSLVKCQGLIEEFQEKPGRRLVVLDSPPLNSKWLGKVNALNWGLMKTSHQLVVFKDADTVLSVEFLKLAVARFYHEQLDLLSVIFKAGSPSGIVRSALSLGVTLLGCRFFTQRRLSYGGGRRGMAAGGFILVKKSFIVDQSALWQLRNNLIDDIGLANIVKSSGGRAGFYDASNLMEITMYHNVLDLFQGIRKNALAGVDFQPFRLISGSILLAIFFWLPWVVVFQSCRKKKFINLILGLFSLLINLSWWLNSRKYIKINSKSLDFLMLPVGALVISLAAICSAIDGLMGTAVWRQRNYDFDFCSRRL